MLAAPDCEEAVELLVPVASTVAEVPAVRRGGTVLLEVLLADCLLEAVVPLLSAARGRAAPSVVDGWADAGGQLLWPRGKLLVAEARELVESESVSDYHTSREDEAGVFY